MKTTLLISVSLVASLGAAGCSFAARSPEMYRDDMKAVLDTKSNDMRACYDGVLKDTPTAAGKVTVNYEVEAEQGKVINVVVNKSQTTAPDPLVECVTKSLTGLVIAPPDKRQGQAT